ncbi:hypothetical protein PMAYCL1PPCAC_16461, partial [Pristionchus mayeri]
PDNRKLREGAMIEFGSFIDKVADPPLDDNCTSERLRASISENTTLAIERILARIDDGQFIAKCTFNGVPDVDRRAHFCQITKDSTTCALSTGPRLSDLPPPVEIRVPEFLHQLGTIDEGDGATLPVLFLTFGSHPQGPVPVPESVQKSRG